MKLRKTLAASVLAITSTFTLATQIDHDNPQVKMVVSQIQAQHERSEELRQQIAWERAPIKTREALEALLEGESPLDMLSASGKERFAQSIVFREKGLGGFNSGDLTGELTPTQIHRILSLFGAQYIVSKFSGMRIETKLDAMLAGVKLISFAKDYQGYYCQSRGTCKKAESNDYICMSGC
ncbi:MAG: hypothetical protein HRT35_11930 [Algicola sp.]|nr:hypothetical protein [Algicola sp.]